MLIEFNVENFLSFKDLTTFSMAAAKSFKEHSLSNLINPNDKLSLLKSAIIYGNNASGKSNLLEAMWFMKSTVLNSFRDSLIENSERKFQLPKFALNLKNANESSLFEISFICNGIKYRYGFELDYDKVVAEWLFHTTTREVFLFKRENLSIEINKSAFTEGIGKEEDVKENVLFLSFLAYHKKSEISISIIEWFKNYGFVNGNQDLSNEEQSHKRYTIEKLKADKDFFNWVVKFIQYLEISTLMTIEKDLNELDFENRIQSEINNEGSNLLNNLQKKQAKLSQKGNLITFHKQYDENNILLDTIPFHFDKQESEGTKKLIYLLGPVYDSLKNGKVLVIDELDSRLHSNLTWKLIEFFHSNNIKNAQLICAVHDVSLLNKEIFRRDQIWFVEKNQFGASELLSLASYKTNKVRNRSAFSKNYIEGKFGAIPYFDQNTKLKEMLYGNG